MQAARHGLQLVVSEWSSALGLCQLLMTTPSLPLFPPPEEATPRRTSIGPSDSTPNKQRPLPSDSADDVYQSVAHAATHLQRVRAANANLNPDCKMVRARRESKSSEESCSVTSTHSMPGIITRNNSGSSLDSYSSSTDRVSTDRESSSSARYVAFKASTDADVEEIHRAGAHVAGSPSSVIGRLSHDGGARASAVRMAAAIAAEMASLTGSDSISEGLEGEELTDDDDVDDDDDAAREVAARPLRMSDVEAEEMEEAREQARALAELLARGDEAEAAALEAAERAEAEAERADATGECGPRAADCC